MKINIINEFKQVNIQIGKSIFGMNKNNILTKYPSPLQMGIIEILIKHKNEDISQNDLKKEMCISKAAISEALNSMEKKNLIKKIQSKNDSRKNIIVLEDSAIQTYEEIKKDMLTFNNKLLKNISEEEIDIFMNVLNKIKNNIKKEVD